MRRGADRGNSVAHAGLEVAGADEAADDGRTGRRDRCLLMGPPGPEIHAGATVCRDRHAGGRRGDGAVVVVDRQGQGLQDAGLGESALDGEQRRAREVALALGVSADRAGEVIPAQVVQSGVVHDAGAVEEVDLGTGEHEVLDGVQEAARAGDHAEAAGGRQSPPEKLEHACPLGGSRAERRLKHGELVHVGEQGCGGSCRGECGALRGCHGA